MESKITYDLEERTLEFGKRIIRMCNALPPNIINKNFINQCIRSGTSVGANYREANDAVGRKDFLFRLRIARKEAKETIFWIDLIIENNKAFQKIIESLRNEAIEIKKILSSIIQKTEAKNRKESNNYNEKL